MRRHRFAASILGALALVATPAALAAPCADFSDVDDSSSFCIHIEWLKNRAITLGCTETQYCPADFVRRDQMAAFLYRLGVQNAFLQGGNAFGTTAQLGTTDNRRLQLNVDGKRALLLEPMPFDSPNLVGGHANNEARVTCTGICIPTPTPAIGVTIGGGGLAAAPNRVTDSFGVVGGGLNNRAGNDNADDDDALGATVAGGERNTASGQWSTVGGGYSNVAGGYGAIVPGGTDNGAGGDWSLAAGRNAQALLDGCFVWGDSNPHAISCASQDQFVARATGGVRFVTGVNFAGTPTAGVELFANDSSWGILSDRASKLNWRDVDTRQVLDRLAAMPIGEWNYIAQSDSIRHMGPSAQDFRAAFGLGHNDVSISTVDADGVALAAIQGLNRKLEQAVATLSSRNAALEVALRELAAEMRALKTSSHVE